MALMIHLGCGKFQAGNAVFTQFEYPINYTRLSCAPIAVPLYQAHCLVPTHSKSVSRDFLLNSLSLALAALILVTWTSADYLVELRWQRLLRCGGFRFSTVFCFP